MRPIAAAGTLIAALSIVIAASSARAEVPPVYVVIFTHVEDNTPGGLLGSAPSRQSYQTLRSKLIAMAGLTESAGVPWTLQPDWKILEAALLYEDAALTANTNGKNLFRYLKEDRGVAIDPHSHENGGYNYTDVAHLLDSLGVGATTVIGGHVWDPSLPQFAEWDRFRVPVQGQHYPGAWWRGDILIGSGTPDHLNDPQISGVWRPRDRDHYFEHDPAGNIVAIGNWKHSLGTVQELISLYRWGAVRPDAMLTFSENVNPATLSAPNGLAAVADTVIAPLVAWRDSGLVVCTDFTALVATWQSQFGGYSYVWDANAPVASAPGPGIEVAPALACSPNPARGAAWLRYSLARPSCVRLTIFDIAGRAVVRVVDGVRDAGDHREAWDASGLGPGAYVCRLEMRGDRGPATTVSRTLVVVR